MPCFWFFFGGLLFARKLVFPSLVSLSSDSISSWGCHLYLCDVLISVELGSLRLLRPDIFRDYFSTWRSFILRGPESLLDTCYRVTSSPPVTRLDITTNINKGIVELWQINETYHDPSGRFRVCLIHSFMDQYLIPYWIASFPQCCFIPLRNHKKLYEPTLYRC